MPVVVALVKLATLATLAGLVCAFVLPPLGAAVVAVAVFYLLLVIFG